MNKAKQLGFSLLLSGAMIAQSVMPALANTANPSQNAYVSNGPGQPQEASASSNVIVAGSSTPDDTSAGGPGASKVSESTPSPVTTTSPAGTDAAPTQTDTAQAQTDAAQTQTDTAQTQTDAVLTESQAAELAAEQAQAEAEANQLNNPLIVPERQPHLQTTVFQVGNVAWSQAYVNDQQISDISQGFSSISTFLEQIHGDVLYRTYNSVNGWTGWAMNGQQTANASSLIPVEAIQYRFRGPVADKFDIYYSTILSDGTTTGWAKNGETAGTMNQGLYITGYRLAFFVHGTAALDTSTPLVSAHADGVQIVDGALRYIHGDGSNYTGWGWQGNDRYYFVDSVPVTGWQYIDGYKYFFQEDGKMLDDVEALINAGGPFQIKINKQMNCMTIYAKDGDNGFIIPVKSFLTSVGDDTPIGTFKTPEKYRWRLMIHDLYTQYATRLGAGLPILIHSIIYDAPNPFTVWASTYNNLGIARSAGCIRLASGDSKWVYDHCAIGTAVTIYNSPTPGPFDRPTIMYEIPFEQTWDPTDPNITPEQIEAESARIIAKFN